MLSKPVSLSIRYAVLAAGVIILGFGISLTIQANLGVSPWTVFHMGISSITGLSVGRITQIVGFFLVLLGSLILKQRPGIGTLINMFLVGFAVDFFLDSGWIPSPSNSVVQLLFLAAGIVSIGLGTGAYISVQLGAGPRDGVMLGLAGLSGWRVGRVRSGMEFCVLISGFLLGGPVGLGTIAGVAVGPIVQFSLGKMEKLWEVVALGRASTPAGAPASRG